LCFHWCFKVPELLLNEERNISLTLCFYGANEYFFSEIKTWNTKFLSFTWVFSDISKSSKGSTSSQHSYGSIPDMKTPNVKFCAFTDASNCWAFIECLQILEGEFTNLRKIRVRGIHYLKNQKFEKIASKFEFLQKFASFSKINPQGYSLPSDISRPSNIH